MRSLESFEDWGEGQNWYLAKANWGDPLFPGVIDEFRIYSRALSDKEIKQNMTKQKTCQKKLKTSNYKSLRT